MNTLDLSAIPADWANVTPEWMTDAVAGRHPGARVRRVTLLESTNGTNRRARFRLVYDVGSGPEVVFAKAEGYEYREVHSRNGNMFNEPELFASGAHLPVDHPLPYKVIIERDALDYVIVMEDVTARGADPRDATQPMTVDQVANGLRGLARLHSHYWALTASSNPALWWLGDWTPTEGFIEPLTRSVPGGMGLASDHLPVELAAMDVAALVHCLARCMTSFTQGTSTLLHGDAHIGNTYVLPDDDVGFLDWQVARRGNWSQDVGYFLVGALTVADRRASEQALVGGYLEALEIDERQRPSFEEAWLRYRATPAYGLPVWLATLNAGRAQAPEICFALCQRYGTAFVDLDSGAALDALDV